MLSTRSVEMSLARPFKAGKSSAKYSRRVATTERGAELSCRYATVKDLMSLPQALKDRAKFTRRYASKA